MNIKYSFFIIILTFNVMHFAFADESGIEVPAIYMAPSFKEYSGEIGVVLKGHINKFIKILDIENGHSDNIALNTLSNYYRSLITKDSDLYKKLFYEKDNSKKTLLDNLLSRNPFKDTESLKGVKVNKIISWSDYLIFSEELDIDFPIKERSHSIICENKKCFISTMIERLNKNDSMLIRILNNTYNDSLSYISDYEFINNEIESFIKFDFFPNIDSIAVNKNAFPISLYLKIKEYNKNLLALDDIDYSFDNPALIDLLPIINFFHDIVQISDSNKLEETKKIFIEHLKRDGVDEISYPFIEYESPTPKVGYRNMFEYASEISKWSSIQPLAYIDHRHKRYVYYRPFILNQAQNIQLIVVDIPAQGDASLNLLSMIATPINLLLNQDVLKWVSSKYDSSLIEKDLAFNRNKTSTDTKKVSLNSNLTYLIIVILVIIFAIIFFFLKYYKSRNNEI